jgi:hypothetical protein
VTFGVVDEGFEDKGQIETFLSLSVNLLCGFAWYCFFTQRRKVFHAERAKGKKQLSVLGVHLLCGPTELTPVFKI